MGRRNQFVLDWSVWISGVKWCGIVLSLEFDLCWQFHTCKEIATCGCNKKSWKNMYEDAPPQWELGSCAPGNKSLLYGLSILLSAQVQLREWVSAWEWIRWELPFSLPFPCLHFHGSYQKATKGQCQRVPPIMCLTGIHWVPHWAENILPLGEINHSYY